MENDLKRLLKALAELEPIEDDDGEPRWVEVLPALPEERWAEYAEACRGRLPAELAAFLSLSAGLRGLVEFEPEPYFLDQDFIGTLRVYDYGNGDGMGLEPAGDDCRVWWVGHDPYFLILQATSIRELLGHWLERLQAMAGSGTELGGWFISPSGESEPLAVGDVDLGGDQDLRAFLAELPEGSLVHDLRGAGPGTEVPFERLEGLSRGGEYRRHGLVLAFLPPRPPAFVAPLPVAHYLAQDLAEDERRCLEILPKGSLVLHERDLPKGSKMDTSDAHPEQDISWRPPFHILHPRPKPWWRFW